MAWSTASLQWTGPRPAAARHDASAPPGWDKADEPYTVGDPAMCRICFRDSSAGTLLSQCNCRGSVGFVHKGCLEERLSLSDTDECNVCSHEFKVEREPKSLLQWLLEWSKEAKSCMKETLLCASLVSALLVASCFSAVTTIRFSSESTACFVLRIILSSSGPKYLVLLYVTVRHHQRNFRRWRQNNWNVRLELPNSVLDGTASADGRGPVPEPSPAFELPTALAPALILMAGGDNNAAANSTAVLQQNWQVTDDSFV